MHLTIKKGQLGQAKVVFEHDGRKDYDHAEADGVEVFVYGYPYHNINRAWISARQLNQYYLQNGLDFVTDMEGSYAIIILDKQKGECLVIIDRYGVYNLLYTTHGEKLVISDNMGELLAELPKASINRRSLLEFLNFGYVMGTKTHIEGVYQFKPAAVHTINSSLHITENPYWHFVTQEDGASSRALTKEELRTLFNQNVLATLQLGEKISLPLTGGMDSRVTFSACFPEKERLHCYTHGIEGCLDIEIARKIAALVGVPHDVYAVNKEWIKNIPQIAERHAEALDGRINAILSAHLENSLANEENKGEVFLTGIGGEMLRWYYTHEGFLGLTTHEEVAATLCERVQRTASFDVYTDYDSTEIKQLLDSSMLETIKDTTIKDPCRLVEYYYIHNTVFNFDSPQVRMVGRHFKIFNPYLNARIMESIPFFDEEDKKNRGLHKYMISRNNPQIASIPTSQDEVDRIREEIARMRKAGFKQPLYKQAANKLTRELFGREIFRFRFPGPSLPILRSTDYPSWLPRYHKEYVTGVLNHDRMILKEFFNKRELNSAVNLFLRGEGRLCYFLTNIMTLEIWLQKMSERTRIEIR